MRIASALVIKALGASGSAAKAGALNGAAKSKVNATV
jgi:hypothetical protein